MSIREKSLFSLQRKILRTVEVPLYLRIPVQNVCRDTLIFFSQKINVFLGRKFDFFQLFDVFLIIEKIIYGLEVNLTTIFLKEEDEMSIKNKNKKTNLLTRIIKDKKGLYVSTAMKIVLSIVLGITTLTGSVLVVKDMVMPRTSEKIAEAFDNDYSSGAGGGGSGGSSTTTRNGTVPEGCTYKLADGTVLNAGADMPFAPSAGDVYTEGDYKYTYNKGGNYGTEWSVATNFDIFTVSSCGEALSEIAGKPVTNMYETFKNCIRLTDTPTIPDSVTDMSYAFRKCESLATAPVIPNSVTNMCRTFFECKSLTTAPAIPDSVTNMEGTFSGCKPLTTAPIIPSSVESILSMFSGCTSLKTYTGSTDADGDFSNYIIPNSVTSMESAFSGCESLTTAPVIPDSVTTMYGTFNGCTSLTAAPAIPNSVTDMEHTFNGCTSLTTAPVIPSSVTNMCFTFCDCTSLTGSLECNVATTDVYHDCCLCNTQITSITGSCPQELKNALLITK